MPSKLKGYEKSGKIIRAVGWAEFIATAIVLATVVIPSLHYGDTSRRAFDFAAVFILVYALFQIFLGKNVQEHKEWARKISIVLNVIQLVGFPLWTFVSVFVLRGLLKGWDEK